MSDILMAQWAANPAGHEEEAELKQQQGGMGEQIKREATKKQLIKYQTLCLGLFSFGRPEDIPLLGNQGSC